MTPAVAVLVPCYDLGRYVDEAVDSVLAQTFQDFEILVVNDGSTDRFTNDLLRDYRRPKTRVVTTENRGLAAARNLAIAETTGRYLCALDADDVLAPTYLERAVHELETDPSLTFVSSWVQLFGEETWVWKQDRCDLPALLAECTVMTAALVRREAVLAAGGYDAAMPAAGDEDWDLWLGLVERGGRGTIIPEVLFHYRQRAGSMRRACSEPPVRLEQIRYLLRKHPESYRRHLEAVLSWKDAQIGDLLRENHALEREIDGRLLRELAERRRQRDALLAKRAVAPAEDPRAGLSVALDAARAEIAALRASKSWRLTAPLRGVHRWLSGVRDRAT